MSIWARLQHFTAGEFGEHADSMNPVLLRKLDDARHIAGVPFKITSAWRTGDLRAHGKGDAVDIRAHDSRGRFLILKGLVLAGFTRIGIYNLHLHADVNETADQEVAWLGKSK